MAPALKNALTIEIMTCAVTAITGNPLARLPVHPRR